MKKTNYLTMTQAKRNVRNAKIIARWDTMEGAVSMKTCALSKEFNIGQSAIRKLLKVSGKIGRSHK